MRKGEFRVRAQRFLLGELNVGDINGLFLFLRGQSFGHEVVRDVGHMVGHADARDKGLSFKRVSDFYEVSKFQAVKVAKYPNNSIALDAAPSNLIIVMEATLGLLNNDEIKRDLNLRRDQALSLLNKVKRRFSDNGNGTIRWNGLQPNKNEMRLIVALTSVLISRPAYDANDLFREWEELLLRHALIDESQRDLLLSKRAQLILFSIASMHGIKYLLPDGGMVEAEAGWSSETGSAILHVTAKVDLDYNGRPVSWSFPIFSTDLVAAQWAEDFEDGVRTATWTEPIELTAYSKLKRIS